MSQRNLIILTKIILFYSIFFVGMKIFIVLKGAWIIPNLMVAVPFLILAVISGLMVRNEKYSWFFVAVGAAVIILTRVYELRLVQWLHNTI